MSRALRHGAWRVAGSMAARRALACALAAVVAAGVVVPATAGISPAYGASSSNATSAARALDYLHARQVAGGGFAEKGGSASEALTAWAIVAIAAAGEDPNAWRVGGKSPVDYLATQSSKWQQTTDVARTTLAVVAARRDPREFGGVDLVAKLRSAAQQSGDAEQIGPYVNSHIWAMLALKAAGVKPSSDNVRWLLDQQNADGGWGWAPSVSSDSNDTAAALQALKAAGASMSSAEVSKALAYLEDRQESDGGFSYSSSRSTSDVNSTAWVIQGLIAAGKKPSEWLVKGHDGYSFLRSSQTDEGYVRYSAKQSTNPLLTTVQAIPSLRDRSFPITSSPKDTVRDWKPTIKVTWPAKGASVRVLSGSALSVTVTDGSGTGVATGGVTVRIDGTTRTASASSGVWRVPLAGLSTGQHTAAVAAVDRAGNTATLASWSFTIASTQAASTSATSATGTSATASAVPTSSPGSFASSATADTFAATATPSAQSAANVAAEAGDAPVVETSPAGNPTREAILRDALLAALATATLLTAAIITIAKVRRS